MVTERWKHVSVAVVLCLLSVTSAAQEVTDCSYMELALVIPTSSDSTRWSQLKSFIAIFLSNLDIGGPTAGARVAIVKYADTAKIEFPLDRFQAIADVLDAVNKMEPLSGTGRNVADAEQELLDIFPYEGNVTRNGAKVVSVIFFDSPSSNKASTINQAHILNNLGIYALSVGLTNQVNLEELQKVATTIQDDKTANVFTVSAYDQLETSTSNFSSFVCTMRKPICARHNDVAIVIDQSTSIILAAGGASNFELIKSFANTIIDSFSIAPSLTRVGVVLFSSKSSIVIELNKYTKKKNLQDAVSSLVIKGGETNIAGALIDARCLLTSPSLGARTNAKKMIFLITDGKSNINRSRTLPEANATKAVGIEIFSIGITNQVDENELRNIASTPQETHYFFASDFESLGDVLDQMIEVTCVEPPLKRTSVTTTTPRPSTITTKATSKAIPTTKRHPSTVASVSTTNQLSSESSSQTITSATSQISSIQDKTESEPNYTTETTQG